MLRRAAPREDLLFPADFAGGGEDGRVAPVGGGAAQLREEGRPAHHRAALILALTLAAGGHTLLAALDHRRLTLAAPEGK